MATSTLIWETDWFPFLEKISMAVSPWYANNWQNGTNWRAVVFPSVLVSRSCIGRNVTILMQMVFVATLCYRYDFALPSTEWEMDWEDYFNLWLRELPMKIWRRKVKASV